MRCECKASISKAQHSQSKDWGSFLFFVCVSWLSALLCSALLELSELGTYYCMYVGVYVCRQGMEWNGMDKAEERLFVHVFLFLLVPSRSFRSFLLSFFLLSLAFPFFCCARLV